MGSPENSVRSGVGRFAAWRWLFRTLLRIAFLIGVIVVLIAAAFHAWFWWKVRTRMAGLRATHKPLTLSELNSYYTAVPAESNAAVVYARAFSLLKTNESFRSLEKSESLPTGSEPLPVELWESMEKVCEENAKTLEVLQEATRFGQCRYPMDYVAGWAVLLPHLPQLSKCAALEMCHGVLQEQKGEVQQAIATSETIMRMAASLDSEPDLVSVLAQNRLYLRGSDLLEWLLSPSRVDD